MSTPAIIMMDREQVEHVSNHFRYAQLVRIGQVRMYHATYSSCTDTYGHRFHSFRLYNYVNGCRAYHKVARHVEFLHVLNRINLTLAFQDQLQQPYADMCALLLSVNTQHSTAMYHGRIDLPRKRLC